MDKIDKTLLTLLQRDASLTVSELSDLAGISATPVWKRIKRLEDSGVIKGKVTLLNPSRVGLNLTGFILIRTNDHSEEWLSGFSSAVQTIPEIVEVHRMTGDVDYLLKIFAPDVAGYDRMYKRLIAMVRLSDVSASFSMEVVKETTSLPLDFST